MRTPRGGRKRKPDFLQVMAGGKPGKARAPKATPMAPPEHLSEVAARVWVPWEAYLRKIGSFRPEFATALEEACELRADIVALRAEITKSGRFYETTNRDGAVMIRPHPACGQLADAQRRLAPYLSEFGLTPVGRAKLLSLRVDDGDTDQGEAEAFF